MTNIFRFLLSTSLIFFLSHLVSQQAHAQSRPFPDDGTYKEVVVKDFEACTALCEAEGEVCRGTQSEQPDTTQPLIYCRLNNGQGAHPLFPSIPPKDLNLDVALSDLNTYRRQNGLNDLYLSEKLNEASLVHAQDLADHDTISHTGSDGSTHGDRVQRQGYYFTLAGENVATGQKSWEKVFQAWKDSPGHNANLLREGVSDFGIAMVYDPKSKKQTFWAMLVAMPIPVEQLDLYTR